MTTEHVLTSPSLGSSRRITAVGLLASLLPLLAVVLAVMQLIDPSRVWTVLLVGLGGLWLVSYLWARSLASGLGLLREMRYGWVQVGDVLEERFTLENKSRLPATWVELQDHSTLPGYDASLATGVGRFSTAIALSPLVR